MIVKNQWEMDAIPEDYEGDICVYAENDKSIIIYKPYKGRVTVFSGHVILHNDSRVRACGHSCITACDNSYVEAYDQCRVKLYGNSFIRPIGGGEITDYRENSNPSKCRISKPEPLAEVAVLVIDGLVRGVYGTKKDINVKVFSLTSDGEDDTAWIMAHDIEREWHKLR